MQEYADYDESAEKDMPVKSFSITLDLIFYQANRTEKVVRAVVHGIVILAMPGGDRDRAAKAFYESQHARLTAFLADNPEWAAHMTAWQEQEATKAAAALLKQQAENERRINEWTARLRMPVPENQVGPKQLDVNAWNALVDGLKNDRVRRYHLEYAFWMAFCLERRYAGDSTSVTKTVIVEADDAMDHYGLSRSAKVEAMKLLIGIWPFAQQMLDTYKPE